MKNIQKKLQIAVIGSAGTRDYAGKGGASTQLMRDAERVGYALAKAGAVVVTGGKDGIMESAARGAKRAGGLTIGVVKGPERGTSNQYTDVEVITGMTASGQDELLIALMADALIVVGGGAGTLQEIALAYRNKKPIITIANTGGYAEKLRGYLDERRSVRIAQAKTPADAVKRALLLAKLNMTR